MVIDFNFILKFDECILSAFKTELFFFLCALLHTQLSFILWKCLLYG